MDRLPVLAVGLLTLLVPRRVVAPFERLAFENPEAGHLRPRALDIARLKGLIVCWALVRRWRMSSFRTPLAALGAVLALVPRTALEEGLALAYENPDDLEVKRWVVPAARLIGACYLAVGAFAGRAGATTGESPTEEPAAGG